MSSHRPTRRRFLETSGGLLASLALTGQTAVAQPGRGRPGGGRPGRREDSVKQGDVAPDFELKSLDGKQQIKLSSFQGKRPVALVFGSYTWPPFRRQADALNRLHKQYGEEVEFYLVYIREAHPSDGWQVQSNIRDGIVFEQPKTEAARGQVCQKFLDDVKITIPPLLDGLDDAVGGAYNAWPDRLYLVDTAGKIAYQSGRGPWGFKPAELEEAIKTLKGDEE